MFTNPLSIIPESFSDTPELNVAVFGYLVRNGYLDVAKAFSEKLDIKYNPETYKTDKEQFPLEGMYVLYKLRECASEKKRKKKSDEKMDVGSDESLNHKDTESILANKVTKAETKDGAVNKVTEVVTKNGPSLEQNPVSSLELNPNSKPVQDIEAAPRSSSSCLDSDSSFDGQRLISSPFYEPLSSSSSSSNSSPPSPSSGNSPSKKTFETNSKKRSNSSISEPVSKRLCEDKSHPKDSKKSNCCLENNNEARNGDRKLKNNAKDNNETPASSSHIKTCKPNRHLEVYKRRSYQSTRESIYQAVILEPSSGFETHKSCRHPKNSYKIQRSKSYPDDRRPNRHLKNRETQEPSRYPETCDPNHQAEVRKHSNNTEPNHLVPESNHDTEAHRLTRHIKYNCETEKVNSHIKDSLETQDPRLCSTDDHENSQTLKNNGHPKVHAPNTCFKREASNPKFIP